MPYIVTISPQGKITVPADIRRALRLDETRKVTVFIKDDAIVVKPKRQEKPL